MPHQDHETEGRARALGEQVERKKSTCMQAFGGATEPLPDATVVGFTGGIGGIQVEVGARGQAECFPEMGSEELFIG